MDISMQKLNLMGRQGENSPARANSDVMECMKCCLLFDWGSLYNGNTNNKQRILLFLSKLLVMTG